ncbi:hypothetical protein [Arcicella rigui]|uniref:Uncharacterized protein n=1 Tax=Arcicella rigui TaxID=797020 RepID=A0ABU5QAB1_9BACT|nr:hypothetical protein [Arcicella rigui]MEA5139776.1 hypothetical protein [Arcicella rigui]
MRKKEILKINKSLKQMLDIDSLGFRDEDIYESTTVLLKDRGNLTACILYSFYVSKYKDLKISGLSYGFFSSEINDILFKVFDSIKTTDIEGSPINHKYEYTINHRIVGEEWYDHVKKNFSIIFIESGVFYEDRVVLFAEMFKKHIETYIEPYFESYQSLQDINDKIIEAFDESKWGDFFYGETNFRVTIIMKLCKNPRYESFTEMVNDRIYSAIYNQGLTEYQNYYKMYNVLLDILSKL